MKELFGMRVYFNTKAWGWRMYGIGYKNLWFIGFSISLQKD